MHHPGSTRTPPQLHQYLADRRKDWPFFPQHASRSTSRWRRSPGSTPAIPRWKIALHPGLPRLDRGRSPASLRSDDAARSSPRCLKSPREGSKRSERPCVGKRACSMTISRRSAPHLEQDDGSRGQGSSRPVSHFRARGGDSHPQGRCLARHASLPEISEADRKRTNRDVPKTQAGDYFPHRLRPHGSRLPDGRNPRRDLQPRRRRETRSRSRRSGSPNPATNSVTTGETRDTWRNSPTTTPSRLSSTATSSPASRKPRT